MELWFEKEMKCIRCSNRFFKIIGADRFYNRKWKEIGRKIIYECEECGYIYMYYIFYPNENERYVIEISIP